MRWEIDFGERPWHRWFAWYPVRIDGTDTQVWWEDVWRRVDNIQGYHIPRYSIEEPRIVVYKPEPGVMGTINGSTGPPRISNPHV